MKIKRRLSQAAPAALFVRPLQLEGKAGDNLVRVGFSNSYRGTTDVAAILRVTGEKGAAFFKLSFELKIKGDLIPKTPRRSSANSKPCSPVTMPGQH